MRTGRKQSHRKSWSPLMSRSAQPYGYWGLWTAARDLQELWERPRVKPSGGQLSTSNSRER
eukprot:13044902-Alexandrium_andersonii.AAC.1